VREREAEAEMLARAIQESLDSAGAANPPGTRRQPSSFTHAPLPSPESAAGIIAGAEEGSAPGGEGGRGHAEPRAVSRPPPPPPPRVESEDDDVALAEAIKLSLLDPCAATQVHEVD